MANRDFFSQNIHDRVISYAVSKLDQVNYDIYTNPGSQKNAGVNKNYPDIIITKKGSNTVEFIIEIETVDSINRYESQQWEKYAKEINASFFILVPYDQKNKAIQLCKELGISVRFGTYTLNSFNTITSVVYE